MNMKMITPIISIVSVVIMMLWGFIVGDWSHAWLAVFIGGALIAILSIIEKNRS